MLATMIPAAFASDLDGHWSKNFIEYLDDEGIINPSATTGKYEPERKVTRAEFMRYVNRAFHFTEKASISYSDVQSNSWYYDTVRIAEKYGYINGTGNGRMNPEGYVTREQAAVILGRLYKANPGNVKPANLSFKDKAQVATWSAGYVKAAVDKGIITGQGHHPRRAGEDPVLLPWNLAFNGRQSLYRLRPQERYRERHHLGKLHAVRCDDRRRFVLDRRSGLGCGTAE